MKKKVKSNYWLKMAEEDLKDAIIDLENKRFPSAVFHSQQCCEKVCKAILSFMGIESGKTHFPSAVRTNDNKRLSEIYDEAKSKLLFKMQLR
jgi:HEPN domain-containing protein